MIRVLIADDHELVRAGLAAILGPAPDVTIVGEATNGHEFVEMHRRLRPDVSLVDLRMPVMDGLQATQAVRATSPRARVVVLTAFADDEDVFCAMRAGAQAYVLKDAERDELLDTIRAVHAGQKRLPPAVAEALADRVSAPELTPREREVLALVAAGQSNKQVAAALFITPGTVKAHMNSILGKLDAEDRLQAVTKALRRGLVRLN